MSIFVSIAAYRDPELEPTIRDCIGKARDPAALRFGVCWQHTEDEPRPTIFDDSRIRVLAVPWQQSQGACWARAAVMQLWEGESFFMQIDSHHRFVQDWDARLLAMADQSGAAKPLLSTYCSGYDPNALPPTGGDAIQMDLEKFFEDAIPSFRPRIIPDWPLLRRSLRARFVSAHFLFAPGRFVTDVPYDPELYFLGEEITLAVRAFTHGYTLLHPQEHLLWHEYSRAYRVKHWDDHIRARGIEMEWHMRDGVSRDKVRRFLLQPHTGPSGCGSERTFAEYETYAGLDFRRKFATEAAMRGDEPPPPPAPAGDAHDVRLWRVRIEIDRVSLSPSALVDPDFWYVGFHDEADAELDRQDAGSGELRHLLAAGGDTITLERRFRSARRPVTWTIWPYRNANGWLDKATGRVDDRAVSVAG